MAKKSFIEYLLNPDGDEVPLAAALREAIGVYEFNENADIIIPHLDEIDIVAGIAADISFVAGIAADIAATVGIQAEIVAVVVISDDIETLAAMSAAIQNVADNEANINLVVTNMTAIQNAPAAAALAAAYASTPEDTPVPGGVGFSALHWAAKAQDIADALDIPVIAPGDAGKVLSVKGDESGSEWVELEPFVGDAGAGGAQGLVPAPTAGDAAAGKVLGAAGGWVVPATVPRGHLYGLGLSNSVIDATNDIDIAAGECASDATAPTMLALAAALTKRLDAAWAVGNNNGGLDTGAIANTTYYLFIIERSDTGVRDVLFSLSPTAPTMPANYDRKRRLGAIIRDAGVILPFSQSANKFLLRTPVNVNVGSNPGTAAVLQTMKVPIGIQVELLAEIYMQSTDANRRSLKITSPDQNAVAPATGTMSTFTAGTSAAAGNCNGPFQIRTNTSGQFRWQLDGSSATTSLFFTANGWIDDL